MKTTVSLVCLSSFLLFFCLFLQSIMIFDDPSFCILTWSGMNKLEGQVTVHLAAHATEDELDLDAVADHHPEEVVLVAGLRQTGGREVGLVRDLGAWVNILQFK